MEPLVEDEFPSVEYAGAGILHLSQESPDPLLEGYDACKPELTRRNLAKNFAISEERQRGFCRGGGGIYKAAFVEEGADARNDSLASLHVRRAE